MGKQEQALEGCARVVERRRREEGERREKERDRGDRRGGAGAGGVGDSKAQQIQSERRGGTGGAVCGGAALGAAVAHRGAVGAAEGVAAAGVALAWLRWWSGRRRLYSAAANAWKALQSNVRDALEDKREGRLTEEEERALLLACRARRNHIFAVQNEAWDAQHAKDNVAGAAANLLEKLYI